MSEWEKVSAPVYTPSRENISSRVFTLWKPIFGLYNSPCLVISDDFISHTLGHQIIKHCVSGSQTSMPQNWEQFADTSVLNQWCAQGSNWKHEPQTPINIGECYRVEVQWQILAVTLWKTFAAATFSAWCVRASFTWRICSKVLLLLAGGVNVECILSLW